MVELFFFGKGVISVIPAHGRIGDLSDWNIGAIFIVLTYIVYVMGCYNKNLQNILLLTWQIILSWTWADDPGPIFKVCGSQTPSSPSSGFAQYSIKDVLLLHSSLCMEWLEGRENLRTKPQISHIFCPYAICPTLPHCHIAEGEALA